MSFEWFQHQRQSYTDVRFPGTHLVAARTLVRGRSRADTHLCVHRAGTPQPHVTGGFSLNEFFEANYDRRPIFYTGHILFDGRDMSHAHKYEFVPHGLTSRVRGARCRVCAPRAPGSVQLVRKLDDGSVPTDVAMAEAAWATANAALPSFPALAQYDAATWEHTVVRRGAWPWSGRCCVTTH